MLHRRIGMRILQALFQIRYPATGLFRAFPFGTVHLQRQSHDHMGDVLVLNHIDHVIDGKEIITGNVNIAGRVCKGQLRVGQRESDPGITQINA